TDSELESDHNSNKAEPSKFSKSLSSQLKDNKKTASLPKKEKVDEISNSEDNEDNNKSDLLLNSKSKNKDEFYSQLDSAFATLLNSQTKKMILFTSREREKARIKLKDKFEKLQQLNISGDNQLEQETLLIAPEITQNPFFESIFGVQNQENIAPLDEL
ncbi:37923_t:CDS:2, partial [Gigaspora margarita]